jgi:hypothetical protein
MDVQLPDLLRLGNQPKQAGNEGNLSKDIPFTLTDQLYLFTYRAKFQKIRIFSKKFERITIEFQSIATCTS